VKLGSQIILTIQQILRLTSTTIHIMNKATLLAVLFAGALSPAYSAIVSLSPGTYTENFNTMAAVSSTPAPGWRLSTNATAISLGTSTSIGLVRTWDNTNLQFKNVSSDNIPANSAAAAQNANTDRALGLRSGSAVGDPGAALSFNFSSATVQVNSISIDLLMLDEQSKSANFTIQYGTGASPTSFTTLGVWSDPGAFGTTTLTFDRSAFGSQLDGQSQAWFRIVALDAATGTGISDLVAIDNFSINSSAVPEASVSLLGAFGVLGLLRRRR
jgi:hypothetical protein